MAGALGRLEDRLDRGLARLEVGREAALVADAGREPAVGEHLLQRVVDLRADPEPLREAVGADRDEHELLQVDRVRRVHAAVDHVQHRNRQRRGGLAAEVAVERLPRVRPPRPWRRRARHRGSRSRRACPCSACRRARSAFDRATPGRARPSLRSRRSISATFATAFVTPLPPHAEPPSRSSTASCTPVDAPEGTAARPNAPDPSCTSTSTVGLPRESRIWRPCTREIELIRVAPLPGRSSGPAPRAAARSSARPARPRAPRRARRGRRSGCSSPEVPARDRRSAGVRD